MPRVWRDEKRRSRPVAVATEAMSCPVHATPRSLGSTFDARDDAIDHRDAERFDTATPPAPPPICERNFVEDVSRALFAPLNDSFEDRLRVTLRVVTRRAEPLWLAQRIESQFAPDLIERRRIDALLIECSDHPCLCLWLCKSEEQRCALVPLFKGCSSALELVPNACLVSRIIVCVVTQHEARLRIFFVPFFEDRDPLGDFRRFSADSTKKHARARVQLAEVGQLRKAPRFEMLSRISLQRHPRASRRARLQLP